MADIERKVTETTNTGVADTGEVVNERTSRVQTSAGSKMTAVNAVWYVFGFIAILLALRFVLKLLGANPENGFVSFIYAISGILSAPFDNIFGVTSAQAGQTQSVFEPSILVAIAIYALIAWGVAKLLTLNEKH
jgi:hypothetical protein